jgi:nucleoside-diphosphate-sugar epimerase
MVCWGDGTSKRDFVFGDEVAQAAIDVVKKEVSDIINFGCAEAVTIKDTFETIEETSPLSFRGVSMVSEMG